MENTENKAVVTAKIREDLERIVKDIKFGLLKTKYGERKLCTVTVFNGDTIDFVDTEGLYDMIATYKKLGLPCVASKKLVEEMPKNPSDETKDGTYVCVLVTLVDGKEFRLFPSRRADKVRIDAYYTAYKQANSVKKA